MKKAEDGKPVVEPSARGLGVREEPVNGKTEIDLDSDGRVMLNRKGMSVAPRWRDLPPFRIPRRLRHLVPSARGNANDYCFAMGEGNFQEDDVSEDLILHIDSDTHGVVAPKELITLEIFQSHLEATRDQWQVDEG